MQQDDKNSTFCVYYRKNFGRGSSNEKVKKGIAYWDKQEYMVQASNCMLKVQGKIAKMKVLNKSRNQVLYTTLGKIK